MAQLSHAIVTPASAGFGARDLAGEPTQRADHDLPVGGRPHVRHRCPQEAAVAGSEQARIEDRDHAPIAEPADQPAGTLGQQQRRVAGRHRHEAVAARLGHRPLPSQRQRLVRPRERDPVDDHQRAGRARHVDALPQGQGSEQAGRLVRHEPPGQLRELCVALAQHGHLRQLLADEHGGRLGRPPRREQSQRATARGPHQLRDLGQRRLGAPRPGPVGPSDRAV